MDPIEVAARAAWAHKEAACAAAGDTDIPPHLLPWRAGSPVAAIICPQVDKQQALTAAALAVPGFGADAIAVTVDAHVTATPVNPATGRVWAPGEMQRACDQEGACSAGLLAACLATLLVRADHTVELWQRKYRVDKTTGAVHWLDPADRRREHAMTSLTGLVPDTLRDCFDHPTVWDGEVTAAAAAAGLTDAHARALVDCATAAAVAAAVPGAQVLLAPESAEAAAIAEWCASPAGPPRAGR